MHKILNRQIKRYLGNQPKLNSKVTGLLQAVSQTYEEFDRDRKLIERSLEISSKELTDKNLKLKEEIDAVNEKKEQLEILNNAMTGREARMAELKEEIEKLRQKAR